MLVSLLPLLTACLALPAPSAREAAVLAGQLRRGEVTVVDTRSDAARERDGVVRGSVQAARDSSGPAAGLQLDTVIFLVEDEEVGDEICSAARCYRGPLTALGADLLEFPPTISFPALSQLVGQAAVLLVDVRNRTELVEPGAIPTSRNIPLHEIPAAFQLPSDQFQAKYGFPLPELEADLVLTCRSGRRALVAQQQLQQLGYTATRVYLGSFRDWVAQGGQVERRLLPATE